MTARGYLSISRSPLWLALTLVLYLSCLAMAVITRNLGLGALGVLGLAMWIWQVTTRKKRLSRPPMSRDEALAYLRAKKGRYTATLSAIGSVLVLIGLTMLIAGIRQDDAMRDTLGVLLIAVGSGWFFVVSRIRRRLREAR